MGFDENDYKSMVDAGLSDSAIYHCAGDSIITTVLACIFGEMLEIDYQRKIEDFIERLKGNGNEQDL